VKSSGLKFGYNCKRAASRGVCRRSLRACFEIRQKSREIRAACLCAVDVNHCKTSPAVRGGLSFRLFVVFV
jgi:hypothetical protein